MTCHNIDVRPRTRRATAPRVRRTPFAVFTALEGALVDESLNTTAAARALVHRLTADGIPVIPLSCMTLEQVVPIASALGLREAASIEAGGAIARWTSEGWIVEACGTDCDTLLDAVREIENRSGASLLVYSALDDEEAARLSGWSGEMLQASLRRQFSEPFVLDSGDLEAVAEAAKQIGVTVGRGRGFLHVCGGAGEGEIFNRLRSELRCEATVAVGTSVADAEFLSRADVSIVVPRTDGTVDRELLELVPNALTAPAPGPLGWAAAVEGVWLRLRVPK